MRILHEKKTWGEQMAWDMFFRRRHGDCMVVEAAIGEPPMAIGS